MIDLYTWTTQNARKVTMMLEECGLEYRIRPVNLLKDEQKSAEIVALNPNGRIPIILDHDPAKPITVWESGAILIYLGEKTGRFLPTELHARHAVLQWLFWQMSAVGPVFGNLSHFAAARAPDSPLLNNYLRYSMAGEVVPYAIGRFAREAMRLAAVLDGQLRKTPFMAGDLSIADFATLAWIDASWASLVLADNSFADNHPSLTEWRQTLLARPGVTRGMAVLENDSDIHAVAA